MPRKNPIIAKVFQALGDPTRRAIVEKLGAGPSTPTRLAALFAITVTAVGQHLQVLERSGLVATEKVGRVRACRIEPAGFAALESWMAHQRSAWEKRLDRLGDLLAEV